MINIVRTTLRQNRGQAGFTLVELLVSLTLVALLALVLFGNLRLGSRAWERSRADLEAGNQVRNQQAFLRQIIAQAYPLLDVSDPTRPHVRFDGASSSLTLLAPTVISLGGAGFSRYSITAEATATGRRLVLRAAPELAIDGAPSTSIRQSVLVPSVRRVAFAYFGPNPPNDAPDWHSEWLNQVSMPKLIRLHIEAEPAAAVWPDLVVAPQAVADIGCVYDPLTKRCRGR